MNEPLRKTSAPLSLSGALILRKLRDLGIPYKSNRQLELPWQNIWHAGHHETMANFKYVAGLRIVFFTIDSLKFEFN